MDGKEIAGQVIRSIKNALAEEGDRRRGLLRAVGILEREARMSTFYAMDYVANCTRRIDRAIKDGDIEAVEKEIRSEINSRLQ